MGEDPPQAGLQLCRQPGPVKGTPDKGLEKQRKVARRLFGSRSIAPMQIMEPEIVRFE
jgi:hypothetical protein